MQAVELTALKKTGRQATLVNVDPIPILLYLIVLFVFLYCICKGRPVIVPNVSTALLCSLQYTMYCQSLVEISTRYHFIQGCKLRALV